MTPEQAAALLESQQALLAAVDAWGMRLCASVLLLVGVALGGVLLWSMEDIFKKS